MPDMRVFLSADSSDDLGDLSKIHLSMWTRPHFGVDGSYRPRRDPVTRLPFFECRPERSADVVDFLKDRGIEDRVKLQVRVARDEGFRDLD